ncbi:MAG: hypothetical protein KJ653_07020, partial [Candidatus Thermoplasmatota archaeon]|nr:hypothetical protein [Candidatus Thermoplasmatota archaeon]
CVLLLLRQWVEYGSSQTILPKGVREYAYKNGESDSQTVFLDVRGLDGAQNEWERTEPIRLER